MSDTRTIQPPPPPPFFRGTRSTPVPRFPPTPLSVSTLAVPLPPLPLVERNEWGVGIRDAKRARMARGVTVTGPGARPIVVASLSNALPIETECALIPVLVNLPRLLKDLVELRQAAIDLLVSVGYDPQAPGDIGGDTIDSARERLHAAACAAGDTFRAAATPYSGPALPRWKPGGEGEVLIDKRAIQTFEAPPTPVEDFDSEGAEALARFAADPAGMVFATDPSGTAWPVGQPEPTPQETSDEG